MLGDGIVSFGVALVTHSCRNSKCSAKIGFSSVTLPSTCIAAGVHSMSPSALWNLTFRLPGRLLDAAELVDEVHVPGRAAELAVGGRAQADVLLQLDRVADRVVLDARSSSASILSLAKSSRAFSSAGGRSRLPTWSARYGGVSRAAMAGTVPVRPCRSATWPSSSRRCNSCPRSWSASCTGCATLRERGAPVRLAAVVLLRRRRADGGDAGLPARAPQRGALPRPHARAPADRRPRHAADRARPHRPGAAAAAGAPALAAGLRPPGRRARGLGGELLPLAPARALPGRGRARRRPRAAAHPLRLLRDRDVDGAARPAPEARVVRQRRRRSATSSPSG